MMLDNKMITLQNFFFPETKHVKLNPAVFPKIHPELIVILRRLRVDRPLRHYDLYTCACGEEIDWKHFLAECPVLKEEAANLIAYKHKHNLNTDSFIHLHKELGWEPARLLCETIYHSDFAFMF